MPDPVAELGDALWSKLRSAQPTLVKWWRGYVVLARSATHSDSAHGENAKISVCGLLDDGTKSYGVGYEVHVRMVPIDASGVELGASRFAEAAAVHARSTLTEDGMFRWRILRTMDSVLRDAEDARVLAGLLVSWLTVPEEELSTMASMATDDG